MIVIYEKSDLNDPAAADRPFLEPPKLSDVQSDKQGRSGYAETVYIARQDGRFQMVKARNAPLDPYPVRIIVTRTIEDEL